jgi:hypothetical protein
MEEFCGVDARERVFPLLLFFYFMPFICAPPIPSLPFIRAAFIYTPFVHFAIAMSPNISRSRRILLACICTPEIIGSINETIFSKKGDKSKATVQD